MERTREQRKDEGEVAPEVAIPGVNRCPFCHDGCEVDEAVVCQRCLARHHAGCWKEGGACSSCGGTRALQPSAPPAVLVTDGDLDLAGSGKVDDALARIAARAGVTVAEATRPLLDALAADRRPRRGPRPDRPLPAGSRLEVVEGGGTTAVTWASLSSTDVAILVVLSLLVVTLPLALWVLWIHRRHPTARLVLREDELDLLEMKALNLLPPVPRRLSLDDVRGAEVDTTHGYRQVVVVTRRGRVPVWCSDSMSALTDEEIDWLVERIEARARG